jgi:SAM-dependent methyltransferase
MEDIARKYACPACKGELVYGQDSLCCSLCGSSYPIWDGIPDFIQENLGQSSSPVLRNAKLIDRLAGIYETWLWYPLVMNVYGGLGSPSLSQLASIIGQMLDGVTGCLLDAACGPGTFGRRLASGSRTVYGVDISMGMLRRGARYVAEKGYADIHFSRARVEALPFERQIFDGAICCGALHLFEDTVAALREIGRTMKPGAPLAVFTFAAGDAGILRFRSIREHIEKDHGAHIFEIPRLKETLGAAGFEEFQPEIQGSVLMFRARRGAALSG